MQLTPKLPRAAWMDRAVMEVGRQMPQATPAQATEIAAELWEEACDLLPAEAVGIYAAEAPPESPGCP